MAILSDWNIDFINKVISHVDGTLGYDTGTGTPAPAANNIIRGSSGTLTKVISISGNATSGTLTVTDVNGRFADGETLTLLESVNFDNVTNNGFSVGDTIWGHTSSRTGVVYKIEYNLTATGGFGTAYGLFSGGSGNFTDNEELRLTNDSGTARALANGTGSGDVTWAGAVNEPSTGTVTPQTICNIINYDAGTVDFPRFAHVQNASSSPTATATVQKVYGVTSTGSLRLVDVTGTWADNDTIYVTDKLNYTNVQTGQKFKVGDKIVGASSGATGKVIVVDTTNGRLTLQGQTGTFTTSEHINVRTTSDTYVADVADTTFTYSHATQNGAPIVTQLAAQGGIYNSDSLNGVRDSNALYTLLQDQFDELSALDDTVPMSAQVALQQFTLINGWKIPDLSYRFIESGSIQDSGLDNIWTNYQTLGSVQGIGDTVYAATKPLPQFYIEQNGSVISPWWLTGHIDVLVKVKTNTDMTTTATSDGLLINSGTITLFNRNYGDTYDHFSTTTIAGVAPVPLATSSDTNNTTGTHTFDFDGGTSSQALTVGEEIVKSGPSADATARGIITAYSTSDSGVTGTVEYILTGTTQFANNDVVTGQTSGFSKTVNGTPTTLVAGYGSRIVAATVDFTVPGTLTSGTFVGGEIVTSSGAGTAIFMHLNTGATTMYIGNATSTFSIANTQTLTGATSGAVFTASGSTSNTTTVPKDIGDGNGEQNYNAVIFLNRDNAGDGDTLAHMYEWIKYRTRSLETTGEPPYNLLGGPGTASGYEGRLYTTLSTTYPLVKVSPLGTFAGGTFFGATGVFVQNMASADIRSFQLIDAGGTPRNPPNLQSLTVTGVVSGDRVAVFRLTAALGSIMTTEFTVGTVGSGNNQTGDSTILVAAGTRTVSPLPSDVPSTGVIRVRDTTSLLYNSYTYSSVDKTTNIFTLSSPLAADLTAAENVYVPLIETTASGTSVSTSIQYVSNIPILTRVRKRGILPFEVEGTFSSSGASVAAIRSFDSIVD